MNIEPRFTNLNTFVGPPEFQAVIPPYQRAYAWTAEQVDDLWGDLEESIGGQHFLGAMVVAGQGQETCEVIDGQQRLTTLLLLVATLRDLAPDDQTLVGKAQRLLTNDFVPLERQFKLRSSEANWPVVRDFVLRRPDDPQRKSWAQFDQLEQKVRSKNEAVRNNAARLRARVEAWLAGRSPEARPQALHQLLQTVATGLGFVVMRVPEVADAFVLFETLNDRGLALSAGDLLKNHLLQKAAGAGMDPAEVAEDWEGLATSLNGADVTRFLRHALLVRLPSVRKEEVFSRFKEELKARGPQAVAAELRDLARWYGEFVEPVLLGEGPTRTVLEELRTLRAVMCYPLLLAARQCHGVLGDSGFVEVARLALNLTFRYSTICSRDSKELERVYQRAAADLVATKGAALEEVKAALRQAMPGSADFRAAFAHQRLGLKYVIDYVLRRIEDHLAPEEKSVRGTRQVHVEHILPKTLNDDWRKVLGERVADHGDLVDRWGNLTLLGGPRNIRASNRRFEEKKAVYLTSDIHLTRRLALEAAWTPESIEVRQTWLAEQADALWAPSS